MVHLSNRDRYRFRAAMKWLQYTHRLQHRNEGARLRVSSTMCLHWAMASNDNEWLRHWQTLHPNEHLSLHVSYPSLSISLCLFLFMFSACHLSLSLFLLTPPLRLTPSLPHPAQSLAVCFWSRLYLCPTLRQSQGFSLSLSFSPHQLSFIDVFLDALCFPPRSFLLHLPLSPSLSLSLCLHSHSASVQKLETIYEQNSENIKSRLNVKDLTI